MTRALMDSSPSRLCPYLYLYLAGDYSTGAHSPCILRLPSISDESALNLHKKIEYTARIAPAQLGKATVDRYRRLAATGWDCFSGLDVSVDMGIHTSTVYW